VDKGKNRVRHDHSNLRVPGHLSDEELALISAAIPPARRDGNKRTVAVHDNMSGSMYVLSAGRQWRAIQKQLTAP
jgi:transposase